MLALHRHGLTNGLPRRQVTAQDRPRSPRLATRGRKPCAPSSETECYSPEAELKIGRVGNDLGMKTRRATGEQEIGPKQGLARNRSVC